LLNCEGGRFVELNEAFAMNAREPFQTDEFFRYAAECRRMASWARGVEGGTSSASISAKWLQYAKSVTQSLTLLSLEALRNAPQPKLSPR
jgi:hypothetical protein